jgi:hypothetical protein
MHRERQRTLRPIECALAAQPDLLHEGDEVVHQVLLHDLPIISMRDGVEVDLERAKNTLYGLLLMQTLDDAWNAQDVEVFRQRHKPGVIVRWPGKTEPTRGIEDHTAESVQVLVGEGLPEVDCSAAR